MWLPCLRIVRIRHLQELQRVEERESPWGFTEQKYVAKRGGKVAATARRELEKQLGQSVVTRQNAKALYSPEQTPQIEEQ